MRSELFSQNKMSRNDADDANNLKDPKWRQSLQLKYLNNCRVRNRRG